MYVSMEILSNLVSSTHFEHVLFDIGKKPLMMLANGHHGRLSGNNSLMIENRAELLTNSLA